MNLIVEVRTGRDQVTMACRGVLLGGREAEVFRRNAILLLGGFDKLTVDVAEITALDCAGVGSLAAVAAHASRLGKTIQISRAGATVREILRIAHLGHLLAPERRHRPSFVPDRQAVLA